MRSPTKTIALVASHFLPSNLVNVHRARLWSQYLPEFGWKPIVVTSHFRHYEEKLDWELMELLDPELEVVRSWALPTRPIRLVGDLGIRGFYGNYRALSRLARARRIDFVHVTIPSNYSALLGPAIYRRFGVPFGIDYNDPWVTDFPGSDVPFSKAWGSARLARMLEPHAVRDAHLITGVARSYFEPVLDRHPHLREQAVQSAMPFGTSQRDFELMSKRARRPFLFDPEDGGFHVFYAGALLPQAFTLLERLLQAIALLITRDPEFGARFRLHFAGTGKSPDDPGSGAVRPYIERLKLSAHVFEHAARIPYLDVLNHLARASANLVLGSTEQHYTPSKAYQVAQAGRPVLALLHEASTAAGFLNAAGAGQPVTFAEGCLPSVEQIAAALVRLFERRHQSHTVNWQQLEQFSARASAKALAQAVDQVLTRQSALDENRRVGS